jgi:hypothetical protein
MKKSILILIALLITSSAFAGYVQSPYPIGKGGTGSSSQVANKAVTTDASGHIVSSSATTDSEIGFVSGVTSGIQVQLNGKASVGLGNLSGVAINADLLCASSGSCKLGSASIPFGDSYLNLLKDGSSVVSVDLLNRQLKNTSGVAVANFSSSNFSAPDIFLTGATSGHVSLGAPSVTTSYPLVFPAAQGASGQYLANDGSGNFSWASPSSIPWSVVDGGNAPYSILAANDVVRSSTTLTADRAYTLPVCNASNIGEKHVIKNLPSQTKNIILTAAGSDNVDGAATQTVLPGDSMSVVCAAFASAGTWDLF